MSDVIPNEVELRFCDKSRSVKGKLAITRLPRLCDLLSETSGDVQVELNFAIDDRISNQKVRCVKGKLVAQLNLNCQRCMEPMLCSIAKEINLGLTENESELDEIPDFLEPFFAEQGLVSIVDLVEQEILLALPLIAKHELESCPAQQYVLTETKATEAEAKQNPFSVLKELRKDLK